MKLVIKGKNLKLFDQFFHNNFLTVFMYLNSAYNSAFSYTRADFLEETTFLGHISTFRKL